MELLAPVKVTRSTIPKNEKKKKLRLEVSIQPLSLCDVTSKKSVLLQRWPCDAPTKVNKQLHLHLRSRDSRLTQFNRTLWTYVLNDIFSPKFLHVLLGVGRWPLGYTKSEDVGLIARAISFQEFQPMWSWSTNVTDGQTTCDRKTIVHRAVKTKTHTRPWLFTVSRRYNH